VIGSYGGIGGDLCLIQMNKGSEMEPNMFEKYSVVTRKGLREPLDIAIVRRRIEGLAFGLNLQFVNLDLVVAKVQQGVHDGITTSELDCLSAETCAYMVRPPHSEHCAPTLQHPRSAHRHRQPPKGHPHLHEGRRRAAHQLLRQSRKSRATVG
jgi:hypothetical protein